MIITIIVILYFHGFVGINFLSSLIGILSGFWFFTHLEIKNLRFIYMNDISFLSIRVIIFNIDFIYIIVAGWFIFILFVPIDRWCWSSLFWWWYQLICIIIRASNLNVLFFTDQFKFKLGGNFFHIEYLSLT